MSGEEIGSLTVIVVRLGVGGQEELTRHLLLPRGAGCGEEGQVQGQGVGGRYGFSLELN